MTRSTRILAACLAGLAVLAAPSTSAAHGPSPIFDGDGLWAQDEALTYDWNDDAMPPSVMRTAITAGAADSNASRGSRAATFKGAGGAANLVTYGTEVVCGIGGLACMRRNPPVGFGLWFRENGHRFDWGTLKWCQFYDPFPTGCYDVENVMLDELGHVQILDHHVNYGDDRDYLDSVVQTFSRTKPKAGWDAHAYGRCDVAQLQRQYDVRTTTKYSTCLGDLATVAAISASATSVPWDAFVVLTGRLNVANDAAITWRLRGNDLDGRTLMLQRRPVGGAWTDVQVMPGSGQAGDYAVTLRVRSTADWRVVFKRPADEPLVGDTSGSVRVAVTGGCSLPPCPQSLPAGGGR